jgi:hypothetical protein
LETPKQPASVALSAVPADERAAQPVVPSDEPVAKRVAPPDESDEPVANRVAPPDEPSQPPGAGPAEEPASATQHSRQKGKRRRARMRTGRLRVQTRPPTEVFVNRRSRGRTPWSEPLELKAGRYLVEMRDAKLGIRYSQPVELEPGGSVIIDKSFGRGALQVFVQPFGEVFVDGKSEGLTPLDGPIPLYEGRHVVRVRCERTGKETTQRVTIRAGKTQRLNVDLR